MLRLDVNEWECKTRWTELAGKSSSFPATRARCAIGDLSEWNDFFHFFGARGSVGDGRLQRLIGHASIAAIGGEITLLKYGPRFRGPTLNRRNI